MRTSGLLWKAAWDLICAKIKQMQVIPAINCPDFDCAKETIKKTAEFLPTAGWIHIDISDGKFTPSLTWNNPRELMAFLKREFRGFSPKVEVNLMALNPEDKIEDWLRNDVNRVIISVESITEPERLFRILEKYDAEAMLSLSPGTPVERLFTYLPRFSEFHLLAVEPGFSGQKFDESVLEKIKLLRQRAPSAIIEVDGGINPETASLVKAAGADIIVSASYILGSLNPREAYEKLASV